MLPIILDLTGRKALVVGGGRIAFRKAKALADEGAHVTVISPDFVDDFSTMPNATLVQRTFEAGDTEGFQLVITATGNHVVDQLIYDEGNACGRG
jgi:precorrin-2 dehydrogenase/sirohydrochlorin ferrochelatase